MVRQLTIFWYFEISEACRQRSFRLTIYPTAAYEQRLDGKYIDPLE